MWAGPSGPCMWQTNLFSLWQMAICTQERGRRKRCCCAQPYHTGRERERGRLDRDLGRVPPPSLHHVKEEQSCVMTQTLLCFTSACSRVSLDNRSVSRAFVFNSWVATFFFLKKSEAFEAITRDRLPLGGLCRPGWLLAHFSEQSREKMGSEDAALKLMCRFARKICTTLKKRAGNK